MYFGLNNAEPPEERDIFLQLQESEEFMEAQAKITPWIWVFSVTGFIMALRNSSRIKKMYGSWKRARKELL